MDNAVDDDDSNDIPADYLFVKSGEEIYEYQLSFSPPVVSAVQGQVLQGLSGATINGINNPWKVLTARRTAQNSVEFRFFVSEIDDRLAPTVTQSYAIGTTPVAVGLSALTQSTAQFQMNGWSTPVMNLGDTATSPSGLQIALRKIENGYALFSLGYSRMVVRDTDISSPAFGGQLQINDDNIGDANVVITGTDTGTSVSISSIRITLQADDDTYVAVNEKMSENLHENGMLPKFDISFTGLSLTGQSSFALLAQPNNDIHVSFNNIAGGDTIFPLYAIVNNQLKLGDALGNVEITEGSVINPHGIFILSFDSPNFANTITHVFRYQGNDAQNNLLNFLDMTANQIIQVAYSSTGGSYLSNPAIAEASIVVAGHQYNIDVGSDTPTTGLNIDLNGNGNIIPTEINNKLVTQYGMIFSFIQPSSTFGPATLEWLSSTMEAATSSQFVSFGVAASGGLVSFSNFAQSGSITVPTGHNGYYPGQTLYNLFLMLTVGNTNERQEKAVSGADIHQLENSLSSSDSIGIINPDQQPEALVYATFS